MIELISAKTDNKVVLFPNWGNLSELYPKLNKAELKEKFELPSNKTIILYSGSVGEKQGLEQIISLSQILIDIPSILFVLAGTGHYFEKLKQQYEVTNKTNLVFKPLVSKEDLNDWLNMADFHIVFQKEETTKFLFPSKLASILSIGGVCIAIVTKETPIYKLFTTHNIGFTYTDTVSLSKDIKTIISKDNQKEISVNARNYAISNLDMNQILENWLKNLRLQ
jgi:colanic acid biosynthesis glycosyl transferase WcaI